MGAPYITPAEFRAAPTAVDVETLDIDNDEPLAQDAQLAIEIAKGSAWCDNTVNQELVAAVHTDTRRRRISRDGTMTLNVPHWPVRQLLALSTGQDGSTLTAVPASVIAAAWIEHDLLVVPMDSVAVAGLNLGSRARLLVRCSYSHGWAATTSTAAVAAGATSIGVADTTSILSTDQVAALGLDSDLCHVTIYDGAQTETVTVTGVAGSTLTVSACQFAHPANVGVSNMPPDLKEAAVLATSAFIMTRGDASLALGQSLQPGALGGVDPVANANLRLARDILDNYEMLR